MAPRLVDPGRSNAVLLSPPTVNAFVESLVVGVHSIRCSFIDVFNTHTHKGLIVDATFLCVRFPSLRSRQIV